MVNGSFKVKKLGSARNIFINESPTIDFFGAKNNPISKPGSRFFQFVIAILSDEELVKYNPKTEEKRKINKNARFQSF